MKRKGAGKDSGQPPAAYSCQEGKQKECAENIRGLKETSMAPVGEYARKPSRPLEN